MLPQEYLKKILKICDKDKILSSFYNLKMRFEKEFCCKKSSEKIARQMPSLCHSQVNSKAEAISMGIVGIGTDIVDIRRIEAAIKKHGERFINKIFTANEIKLCKKRTKSMESFAKIFAVKEAVLKAISDTGGIFWHDMEILHEENGKPYVVLRNKALENMLQKTRGKHFNINVSVSDEINYAIAFVVIES